MFLRWWRALPLEDRDLFMGVYGGDELLARFVCAMDYLRTQRKEPPAGAMIVTAYAVAADLDPMQPETRIRAAKAWRHDATQALLERLAYRSRFQAAARIETALTHLIESEVERVMKPDYEPIGGFNKDTGEPLYVDPYKPRTAVATLAMQFLKLVQTEDVAERTERLKRGFQKVAENAKAVTGDTIEQITPEAAMLYLRVMHDGLGEEAFREAVGKVQSTALEGSHEPA